LNYGVHNRSFVQTAFTRQRHFGKEAREAQWAHSQRLLHGLHPPELKGDLVGSTSPRELGGIADQAKRRAEIARYILPLQPLNQIMALPLQSFLLESKVSEISHKFFVSGNTTVRCGMCGDAGCGNCTH